MKQLFLLTAFFFLAPASRAQIYLGFTKEEIVDRVSGTETCEETTTGDGTFVLTVRWKSENAYNRYYYFKHPGDTCSLYVVEPLTRAAESSFVEFCNRAYVVLDTKTWRVYLQGQTVGVRLHYVEGYPQHLFYFSVEE